jgi:hypothetical protein
MNTGHNLPFPAGPLHRLRVDDIAADEQASANERLVPGGEIVERDRPHAVRRQEFVSMRTDIPGAPDNEYGWLHEGLVP